MWGWQRRDVAEFSLQDLEIERIELKIMKIKIIVLFPLKVNLSKLTILGINEVLMK